MNVDSANIALVHDWLNQRGGAENVLEQLVDLFGRPPVYTSMYAADVMPADYEKWDIRTGFVQHLPGVTAHHQRYLPLYPAAFARTDLSSYDLVISNKSGFCHGVKTVSSKQRAIHVCYCLTPTRFLWLYDQYRAREEIGGIVNLALQPLLATLRRWDRQAARRVDHFVAISRVVQERIRTIYDRDSTVIHPPVDTSYFRPDPTPRPRDYYLIVSRLIPYKRIDLAIDAFRELPQERLVVVGEGRDAAVLQARSTSNVSFLGRQSRARILELLHGCKAFIFPGLEDFGIAPVEAMSAGRPVIAFGGGGALDTVPPGSCGEFFAEQTSASLLSVLQSFDPAAYAPAACRLQAECFDTAAFRRKLKNFVQQALDAGKRLG